MFLKTNKIALFIFLRHFKYNYISLQQLLKKDGLIAGKSNKYY